MSASALDGLTDGDLHNATVLDGLTDGDLHNATVLDGLTDEEIPIKTPSNLVACTYGSLDAALQVQVPKETLLLFRLFRDINEDCPVEDGSFFADIPIIKDAKAVPIYFTKEELDLFFELASKEPLTIQHLDDSAITSELLKRFLLLVNFLDYEDYLHTLCQYAALLIKEGKFALI